MKTQNTFWRCVWICVVMAFLILAVNGLATIYRHSQWGFAGLSFAVATTAIVSFFGFLVLAQSDGQKWKLTDSHLRLPITASIVVVYLNLVALAAFITEGPEKLTGITEQLVTNFTTIVGIVIAFYFGSSAYIQVKSKGNSTKEGGEDTSGRSSTSSQ